MKVNLIALCGILMVLSGCKDDGGDGIFERGETLAELTDKRLKEVSGLASSVKNPGMLWAHNDAGNDAEIFLVDQRLNIQMTVTLAGVENRDWEDIAIGPGPDSSETYVYVGDIGDNDAAYPVKNIYRFPEPAAASGQNVRLSEFDVITFRLEGPVKDTESLFVDSRSGNVYVVSKREEPVFVYELKAPQVSNDTLTAFRTLSLPFTKIVAADFYSRSGDILMKNYTNVYYWKNDGSEDVVSLLKKQPIEIPYEEEPQGESIAWAADGSGFYVLSEKKKKDPSYLYFYSKKEAAVKAGN